MVFVFLNLLHNEIALNVFFHALSIFWEILPKRSQCINLLVLTTLLIFVNNILI